MSEHLDKAKAALDAAKDFQPDPNRDPKSITGSELMFTDLLRIASVQAEVAQAETLERIADQLKLYLR